MVASLMLFDEMLWTLDEEGTKKKPIRTRVTSARNADSLTIRTGINAERQN